MVLRSLFSYVHLLRLLHFLTVSRVQVPSFDSKVAMEVVRQEFGRPWHEVFAELSPEPIAAASLGQV